MVSLPGSWESLCFAWEMSMCGCLHLSKFEEEEIRRMAGDALTNFELITSTVQHNNLLELIYLCIQNKN